MKNKGQISYIFRVLNEDRKQKIFYFLALMIDALAFPLAQVFTSLSEKLLVNAIEFDNIRYMNGVYILSFVIFVLIFFINPSAEYFKEKSVSCIILKLKNKAADKLLHVPLRFYNDIDSGEVIVRMTSDIDGIKGLFSWSFHRFFLAFFYGIGSIAFMIYLCWQLSIVILILAFFEIFCIAKVSVKIQRLSKEIQEEKAKGNNLYSALIKCLKCIKMLSLHNIMHEKYSKINLGIAETQIKRGTRIVTMNIVSDFFGAVNLLGTLSVGIILYFGGYVDLGSVMAFLVIQDGITYMFSGLKDFFASLQQYITNVKRVYEMIDKDYTTDVKKSSSIKEIKTIEFQNVYFRYEQGLDYVLENVNIKVKSGDIIAIAGESGKGKSTFVKLLMGFYQPSKGKISYNNISNSDITSDGICEACAYVPQFPYLFYDTVAENIRGGNEDAAIDRIKKAAQLAGASEFIESREDGFSTMILDRGAGYSGGQKQKIAIARAILSDKNVIIFDEATSALDTESEKTVYNYLQKEAQKGKIIIAASHRESINTICNLTFCVDNGQVYEQRK